MKAKLPIGVFIVCVIGCLSSYLPAAPVPKEMPKLKCEMRWTGKVEFNISDERITEDIPDTAIVTITNISDADVDIGSHYGPYAYLDLRVKDPAGADVKTEPLNSYLSTLSLTEPIPCIIKPSKAKEFRVCLLGMVPEEKRVAGTYKVKAIYTIGKVDYESDEISIEQTELRIGERNNGWLIAWFIAYVFAVGAVVFSVLALGLGLLLPPWDCWWVFLFVTPQIAALQLLAVRKGGHFSKWAIGLFWLAAVALGLWMQWVSYWMIQHIT
jgi:hypothetical protein